MLHILLFLSVGLVHFVPPLLWPATPWHLTHFLKPNCSFCKEIEPEFLRVSKVYSSITNISFYQIDCGWYPRFCRSHSTFGVPSIVLCDKKCRVLERFAGRRSSEHIIAFVESHTSLPPPVGFLPVRDATLDQVYRAIASLKCVGVPAFFRSVPIEVREALDTFVGDPEFAAFALNDRDLFRLALQFALGPLPAVLFLTLFDTSAFSLAEATHGLADKVRAWREGSGDGELRDFVLGLINGHQDRQLDTIFGPFHATGDCIKFAQLMNAATDDEITQKMHNLREMILSARMDNQTQRQLSARILILKELRQIRSEGVVPDDGL
jgi:hypothetical protein